MFLEMTKDYYMDIFTAGEKLKQIDSMFSSSSLMNRETGWKKPAAKFLIFLFMLLYKDGATNVATNLHYRNNYSNAYYFWWCSYNWMYYVIVLQNLMTLTAWKNK